MVRDLILWLAGGKEQLCTKLAVLCVCSLKLHSTPYIHSGSQPKAPINDLIEYIVKAAPLMVAKEPRIPKADVWKQSPLLQFWS